MVNFQFIILPEVEAFILELEQRKNRGEKNAKIMFDKVVYCMARVELEGIRAGKKNY